MKTSPRSNRAIVAASIVGMFAVIIALWWLSERAHDREIRAEHERVVAEREARLDVEEKVQALEGLEAATAALRDQCRKGIASACHQLVGLRTLPSSSDEAEVQELERQETEIQELEVQEREEQEREIQEPELDQPESDDADPDDAEIDQPERDDAEEQDEELQDEERQDDEVQEAEEQDREIQDEEVQDPELDDPDPNSRVTFAAVDNCSPPPGEIPVDFDFTVLRDPDALTVTYVLTCRTVTIASLFPGNGNAP